MWSCFYTQSPEVQSASIISKIAPLQRLLFSTASADAVQVHHMPTDMHVEITPISWLERGCSASFGHRCSRDDVTIQLAAIHVGFGSLCVCGVLILHVSHTARQIHHPIHLVGRHINHVSHADFSFYIHVVQRCLVMQ